MMGKAEQQVESEEVERILLVEDEAKVSSFIARGLTAERFAVDVAADGPSGGTRLSEG